MISTLRLAEDMVSFGVAIAQEGWRGGAVAVVSESVRKGTSNTVASLSTAHLRCPLPQVSPVSSSTHVFISYSRRDERIALAIADRLAAADVSCWIDQRNIRPGQDYSAEIVAALNQSRAVVLVFSDAANESKEIRNEIQLAASRRLPIYPFRLSAAAYHPSFEYHLAAAQWIDATADLEAAIARLVGTFAEPTGTPPNANHDASAAVIPGSRVERRGAVAAFAIGLLLIGGVVLARHSVRTPEIVIGDPRPPAAAVNVYEAAAPSKTEVAAPGPRIAVLYFDYSGGDAKLGTLRKGLADMLVTDFGASGSVQVVERERLEAVMKELSLQTSDAIDPASAARVGKLLGAEYLILGSYFDMLEMLRIDAKAVRVETGAIITSKGVSGSRADFAKLESQLAEGLLRDLAPSAPSAPSTAPSAPSASAAMVMAYSRILDQLDAGDRRGAQQQLQAFSVAHPTFRAATRLQKRM